MKKFFTTERNMMVAIVINALVIFLISFPSLSANELLYQMDYFFIVFFLIEALVKIISYGPRGYFKDGWNVFDFLLVLGSIPALLAPFIQIPDTSLILLLRLFRLFRLLRLIKVVTFIPRLHLIVNGLGRALKASVFVFMLLMFFAFLLALFSCQIYSKQAPEFFGDPFISMYTMFQLFTIEGWNEIPSSIAEHTQNDWIAAGTRIYFLTIVLLGGILGMSLANAVFVDEMTMDNNQVLENKIDALNEEIQELKALLRSSNEQ